MSSVLMMFLTIVVGCAAFLILLGTWWGVRFIIGWESPQEPEQWSDHGINAPIYRATITEEEDLDDGAETYSEWLIKQKNPSDRFKPSVPY